MYKKPSQLKVVWEHETSIDAQERILAALEMIIGDVNNIEIVDNSRFTKSYPGFSMANDASEIRGKRISNGRRSGQGGRRQHSDQTALG